MLKHIVCILTVIGALQGCNSNDHAPAERTAYVIPDSLYRTLSIDTVKNCDLVGALTFSGMVDFNQDNQVSVYPMVSGTIQDVKVELGDHVEKGQLLAVVKSAEMAGISNDLTNAETNLLVARQNLEKTNDMFKSGLASRVDQITAQASFDQAQSELNRVKKVVNINGGSTQGDYLIKAPISGVVVQKNISNNTQIRTDNGNNLFSIADLQKVWVQANVYESDISNIHTGDAADVTTLSYPGKVFKGTVDKMQYVLDPTNKVMKVKVVLPNPGYQLKPQMFASITVTNPTGKQALCIPSSALVFDNSQNFVLVFKDKAHVQITPVQVLNTTGQHTYISDGLQPGQLVISSQAILLYGALNN